MKGALGNTLEGKRLDRWIKLLSVMRAEDAPAIAALLHDEQMAGREFKTETMAFWQSWAAIDPQAAWAFAQEHEEGAGRHGVEALLKAWAFGDSHGAMEAFKQMGDSSLKGGALAGLAHGLAESDPKAALEFVVGLPPELQREASIHISGSIIYALGNEGAATWFDTLPAEAAGLQKEVGRVLLESLSRSDKGAVEDFAAGRLDQAWMAQRDEQSFTVDMINRNGGSPWEFVGAVAGKFPDADSSVRLATRAALRRPDEAVAWLQANPDHPGADAIRAGAAVALVGGDRKEEGFAMIEQIKDAAIRERADRYTNQGG